MPRPSQLDLDVPVSVYPAPDILSLRFGSCDDNHGNSHVLLQGYFASNYYDFHLSGADGFFHRLQILIRRIDMNGFAF